MAASEENLIEQAVAGDTAALGVLLERHGPRVRRAVCGRIGKRWQAVLDADDVMQVTYLHACLHIDQLKERKTTSFTAWLTRIAENNLRDAISALERPKRPNPTKRIQSPPGEDSYISLLELLGGSSHTPSRDAARCEAARLIDEALERLPEDYVTAVRLYDLEGRSAAEVATSMGRSVGAVHMLRARAHDRLRNLLGTASDFFSDSP
jgi:RNA polymerase sigma-70 factor (ECF subfamily)